MKLATAFIALAMPFVEAIDPVHRLPPHHHTHLDGEWTLDCRGNEAQYGVQAISLIEARFHGDKQDKEYAVHCRGIGQYFNLSIRDAKTTLPPDMSTSDIWDWTNVYKEYNQPGFLFDCGYNKDIKQSVRSPEQSVITRIWSRHDNHHENRQWKFTCSRIPGIKLVGCFWSPWSPRHHDWYTQGDSQSSTVMVGFKIRDPGGDFRTQEEAFKMCQVSCDESQGLYKTSAVNTDPRFVQTCTQGCPDLTDTTRLAANEALPTFINNDNCRGRPNTECFASCPSGYTYKHDQSRAFCRFGFFGINEPRTDNWGGDRFHLTCVDIDECSSRTLNCVHPATCVNTLGSAYCQCPAGQTIASNGKSCIDASVDLRIHANMDSLIIVAVNPPTEWTYLYFTHFESWAPDGSKMPVPTLHQTMHHMPTSAPIILNNQAAGTRYHIVAQPADRNAVSSIFESTLYTFSRGSELNVPQVSTACGPGENSAGHPTNVRILQEKGKVFFAWTDASACEVGFTFLRNGRGLSLQYDYTSSEILGFEHAPRTLYDDLVTDKSHSNPGTLLQYCISAVNPDWYPGGYSSRRFLTTTASCPKAVQHTVLWESRFSGHVLLPEGAGSIGVNNVTISYELEQHTVGPMIQGTVATDVQGYFSIELTSSHMSQRHAKLYVTPRKISNGVRHRFAQGSIPLTGDRIEIELYQFQFDASMILRDLTSALVRGSVYYSPFLEADSAIQVEALPSNNCGLSGVTVCLHHAMSSLLLGCATTGTNGAWHATIPINEPYYVKLEYAAFNHTFAHAQNSPPEGFRTVTEIGGKQVEIGYFEGHEGERRNIDFVDTSTRELVVEPAGGKCNKTLGDVRFLLAYCSQVRSGLTVKSTAQARVRVPAQQMQMILDRVSAPGELLKERISIKEYFNQLGTIVQSFDARQLDSGAPILRWEYHPLPSLSINIPGAQTDCKSQRNVVQMASSTRGTLKVTIRELFPDGGTCDYVPGNVTVVNRVGIDPSNLEDQQMTNATAMKRKLQTACFGGCSIPIEHSTSNASGTLRLSAATVRLPFMTGYPAQSPPFTKSITVRMNALYTTEKQSEASAEIAVVVRGHINAVGVDVVTLPEFMPMLVLFDPPGGNSFASYRQMQASLIVESEALESFTGTEGELSLGGGFNDEKMVWAGVAIGSMENVFNYKTTIMHYTDFEFVTSVTNVKTNAQSLTVNFDYTTSADPRYAGSISDMYLVPSLRILVLRADMIELNFSTCAATATPVDTWTLTNNITISWRSRLDIITYLLPSLEDLAKQSQKNGKLQDAFLFEQASRHWRLFLQQDEDILGNITAQTTQAREWKGKHLLSKDGTSLVSDKMLQQLKTTGGVASNEDERQMVKKSNSISFSGGGAAMTYTVTKDNVQSNSNGDSFWKEARSGIDGSVDIGFGKVDFLSRAKVGAILGFQTTDEVDDVKTEESSISFTFSDPDEPDFFDVDVYVHPVYNTFMFVTKGGRSSCIHEEGTVPNEVPHLELVEFPTRPFDPNQPAHFRVKVANFGPSVVEEAAFELNAVHGHEEGLEILVNGYWLPYEIHELGQPKYLDIQIIRGTELYDYNFTLRLASLCEVQVTQRDEGYIKTTAMLNLAVHFAKDCPKPLFVGSMTEQPIVYFNREHQRLVGSEPQLLYFLIHNPSQYKLSSVKHLQRMILEYRPFMGQESLWFSVTNRTSKVEDLRNLERPTSNLIQVEWNLDLVADGMYFVRIQSTCTGVSEDSTVLNTHRRQLTIAIDRTTPQVFGSPEPADNLWQPGDTMGFAFNEDIKCTQPLTFTAKLDVDGLTPLNTPRLHVHCSGSRITCALEPLTDYALLSGKQATLTLSNVRDLAGNPAQEARHIFVFQKLNPQRLKQRITLRTSTPYAGEFWNANSNTSLNFATSLVTDVTTYLNVSLSRAVVVASSTNLDNNVGVVFDFEPGTPDQAVPSVLTQTLASAYTSHSLPSYLAAALHPVNAVRAVAVPQLTQMDAATSAVPQLFAHFSEPADGLFEPGDEISATFNVPLDCSEPYAFGIEISLSTQLLNSTSYLIVCHGRKIELSLAPLPGSRVAEKQVTVQLSNVRSVAGEVARVPLTWVFTMGSQFKSLEDQAPVLLSIPLGLPWTASYSMLSDPDTQTLVRQLIAALAWVARAPSNMLEVQRLDPTPAGSTTVLIRIMKSAGTQRRRIVAAPPHKLAQDIVDMLSNPSALQTVLTTEMLKSGANGSVRCNLTANDANITTDETVANCSSDDADILSYQALLQQIDHASPMTIKSTAAAQDPAAAAANAISGVCTSNEFGVPHKWMQITTLTLLGAVVMLSFVIVWLIRTADRRWKDMQSQLAKHTSVLVKLEVMMGVDDNSWPVFDGNEVVLDLDQRRSIVRRSLSKVLHSPELQEMAENNI